MFGAGAITTNTAQYISVSTNTSAIVLGECASLSVDSFAGFGDGGRLNVTLGEGATLHFGTTLSGGELRRIRVNGNHRAEQDENGMGVIVELQAGSQARRDGQALPKRTGGHLDAGNER